VDRPARRRDRHRAHRRRRQRASHPRPVTVVDETEVDVRFVVIADVGTEVVCTLRAVNTEFTEVGARDVRIGPVTENRTAVTETITTTELAASGHADRCSAVDP
jgi:ribosomal protein L18